MPSKPKADNAALTALKRDLKAGTPNHLYVFHGEETYLREHYLKQLRKLLLSGGMAQFNLHTAQGKECSPEWLEQAVDCLPMMSERTLVLVTDYDLFGGGEAQQNKLVNLFRNLPEYCCLVFVYDTIPFRQKKGGNADSGSEEGGEDTPEESAGGKSAGSTRKLSALLKKMDAVVEFRRQEAGDLTDWITRHFKHLGHTVERADAQYLIFLCGELMTNLSSEIEKVAAYADKPKVTRADMEAVVIQQLDAQVFQITDAILQKKFDRAASVLADLLHDRQPPIMILAVLGKYFRQLYSARLCLEARQEKKTFMAMWNMKYSFQADKLLDGAKKFSLPWCRHAVRRCAETDLAIKNSYGQEEELLIGLLMELAAGRKAITA